MKRVLGVLAGASFALVIGCAQSYDMRLEETIKNLEYKRDLDKNTEGPPTKSNLETAKIYLRAPKGLRGPSQTFPFVVEPGKFDITDSFIDQKSEASLHILARTNAPKGPAKKATKPAAGPDEAQAQAPTAVRGDFTTDVVDFIKSAYSTEFDPSQLKVYEPGSHGGRKSVSYKAATIDTGAKQVKVYFHGDKNGPAQVALIFEGTQDSLKALISQIEYSLNSLAVGPRAASLYGGQDELSGDEAPATPAVF
jgi:hypothetical protein